MARKKGKGKGPAKTKTTPRHSHPKLLSPQSKSLVEQAQEAMTAHFSLRDEVRWMSNRRSTTFDAGKKLSRMPITFVSAGLLEGTVKEKAPAVEPAAPPPLLNSDALAQMTIRSPSPSPSVSSAGSASSSMSEEIVVFRGRGGHTPLPESAPSAPSVAAPVEQEPKQDKSFSGTPQLTGDSSDEPTSISTAAAAPSQVETSQVEPSVSTQEPAVAQDESDVNSDTDSVVPTVFEKRRKGRPIWEGKTTPWVHRSKPGIGWLPVQDRPSMDAFMRGEVNPQDAAMEDYMQNIEDFGLKAEMLASAGFARREMDLDGGSHNDWEPDADHSGSPNEAQQDGEEDGWNSDMLRDLDGMSTSTDIEDTVARILNKRTRTAGLQYLVVYEGSTPDDARWLPASFLKTPAEQLLIRKFEAKVLSRPRPISSNSDSSSDSEFGEDQDGVSDEDGEEVGDDELDDETIARVLQKQEEFGLGSDKLVLYAHDAHFRGSTGASVTASSITFDRPSKKRQHHFGYGKRTEPSFPSAAAMADALDMDPYAGFDIMDTERPSLRPLRKGRRGQMPPEIEDSDLNEQVQASWEADRANKRLKKAKREELRKQGLLGRKGKAPDLSVKYKDGVTPVEVFEEIREFMVSDMQTLSLPPMEAHRRAAVHQLVKHFSVNSKSRGDGANRFTVLSKTHRTTFDHDTFDALLEKKKFKNRMIRGPIPPSKGKKEKALKARPTVYYKDGEVVGASAPELGPENRGRALLEKMGWSKGMALGAHDNKGILLPIAHTVKTTKAGLQ